jgi:formylglycine-generating enzyme required for sulfatase activity
VKGYKGFDRHRVAVYPFKENDTVTELGTQIARELPNSLADYIKKTSRDTVFEILTRTQLDQIVREQRITMSELFEKDDTSFGKLLKATAIISGNIARREGGVFITAQIVDRSSGKLIGNAEVRFREESVAVEQKRDNVSDTPLNTERDPTTHLSLEIMTDPDKAVMVLVPGGLFKGAKVLDNKLEAFKKDVKTFYIDKYEVTNEQYCRFLNAGGPLRSPEGRLHIDIHAKGSRIYIRGSSFRVKDGFEKYPVVNVTYYGASAYAEWAGKRLPELAEWQKAAGWDPVRRKLRTYPWGRKWHGSKCNHGRKGKEDDTDGYKGLAPVMKFKQGKSFYNVFNISGNVWEWCADIERKVDIVDSMGTKVQKVIERGVIAGGSFRKGGDAVKTTSVLLLDPGIVNFSIGFRCVKDPG